MNVNFLKNIFIFFMMMALCRSLTLFLLVDSMQFMVSYL